MPVPGYQSFMLPLMRCALEAPEVKVYSSVEKIADALGLTEQDRKELLPKKGKTLVYDRTHWAKTYLVKAGLLDSVRRGYVAITPAGKALLAQNPENIDLKTLQKYEAFNHWYGGSKPEKEDDLNQKKLEEASPEERIERAHFELEAQLKKDLLEKLYDTASEPDRFERIIVDLLIAMGYGGGRVEAGRALGKTGDGGVDGEISEDELGLDVIYIQAKCHNPDSTIGRPEIQSFVGSLEGKKANKGVFVTTANFAKTSEEYVKQIQKSVVLIDGKRLTELMLRRNVGVRIKEKYELKSLDEDYFDDI